MPSKKVMNTLSKIQEGNGPEPQSTKREDVVETLPPTLDQAFEVIKDHLVKGHKFTFEQMDIGIELSLKVMPDSDQDWFREIATMNTLPLWQALWGQWRRNTENGVAQAPICDPGWEAGEVNLLTERLCGVCGATFMPKNFGGRYCSNKCGAIAEKNGHDPKEAA